MTGSADPSVASTATFDSPAEAVEPDEGDASTTAMSDEASHETGTDSDDSDGEDDLETVHDTGETSPGSTGQTRRTRTARVFPALAFKEALFLAEGIQLHGGGKEIRRLTLFEAFKRSPDGGTTRRLISSSNQYGLTTGGYRAEFLALTPLGATASDPDTSSAARLSSWFQLAIEGVTPFKHIYGRYVGGRLPTVEVLRDTAREAGVQDDQLAECVEIFLANARQIGLVRQIAGSEHIVSIDAVLERQDADEPAAPYHDELEEVLPATKGGESLPAAAGMPSTPTLRQADPTNDLDDVCFVISPIGSADSIERKHADLVLSSLIIPALKELGLRAVRADRISRPGLITGQVIDHVARARLVIADLSFANPNVYYELALRNATKKPVVQLIRAGDKLPFDVGQYRTVEIDMTDIYTLVPQIDLHRQEIARQCRAAIAEGASADSPLSQFYPAFWSRIATEQ